MYQPVKIAWGEYLGQFFNCGIVPTTKALNEYAKRPLNQAIVWAPSRMVDLAEEMLAAWQRDDSRGKPTLAYTTPIILVALAQEISPIINDFNRGVSTPEFIVIEEDVKQRLFKLRSFSTDIRTQLVIAAHDDPTARALASQLLLYFNAFQNRRFYAAYQFAGFSIPWPIQIALPDSPASLVPTDAKNLTLLTLDLTLHATVPLYQAPKDGEQHDEQGDPTNPSDPAGYPKLLQINVNNVDPITSE